MKYIKSRTDSSFKFKLSNGSWAVLPDKRGNVEANKPSVKPVMQIEDDEWEKLVAKSPTIQSLLSTKRIVVMANLPAEFVPDASKIMEANLAVKEAQDKANALQKEAEKKNAKIKELQDSLASLDGQSQQWEEANQKIKELEEAHSEKDAIIADLQAKLKALTKGDK